MHLGLPVSKNITDICCAIASVWLWDLREGKLVARIELYEKSQIRSVTDQIANFRAISKLFKSPT